MKTDAVLSNRVLVNASVQEKARAAVGIGGQFVCSSPFCR
jgi:hypothetical protein